MPTDRDILPERYRGPVEIGRGGMGEIYRATDDVLGRPVAVKILAARYAADAELRRRFTREALAAARLSAEPSIVTIYDVGEWNQRPFIVMEYLGGGSVHDRLRARGRPSAGQALTWLEQAAAALDAAHRHGVVHRDVKPGNLLLDRQGDVHVADFGVASAAGLDSLTATGTVLGTAGYLAPEQARGERAGPASDRYALAVVAFELLAGERPYAGETPAGEAVAHQSAPVPRISERDPSLPRELDAVFARALAKEPEERFQSCAELVAHLGDALEAAAGTTQILAPPHPAPAPDAAGRPPRRRRPARKLVPLLAALAAAGAGAAAALVISGGDETTASPQTVRETVVTGGATVTVATTVHEQPPPPPPSPEPPSVVSGSGHSLNDRGYALMQDGEYEQALPLLQAAVRELDGAGPSDPYEGYANYNLGYTLLQLGRCAEALPYLEKRERLSPGHPDVARALLRARTDCRQSAHPKPPPTRGSKRHSKR